MDKQVVTVPGGTVVTTYGTVGLNGSTGVAILAWNANKKRKLLSVVADVTCTATVGNRVIVAAIYDSTGGLTFWKGPASGNTTASQVCGYDIAFPYGITGTTVRGKLGAAGNVNVQVSTVCPMTEIAKVPAGNTPTIWFYDTSNIDVADSLVYRIQYIEYEGQ